MDIITLATYSSTVQAEHTRVFLESEGIACFVADSATNNLKIIGGVLLAISGVMSIAAFAGTILSIGYLTGLSVAGGVVFLLSLVPITRHYLTTPVEP